ncbi:hypothetical protein [Flavobacterium foetidum]|uniref:hypothetical protein n=1 Tax=Flavobacterium foetidum TaxID=2026681 RepID=UPI0010753C60|nr:hypothetical protein [Flavobacterium foetidum]KAF2509091.1 hypothetical protein E0W73_18965 [Flavobacterium foetidum]
MEKEIKLLHDIETILIELHNSNRSELFKKGHEKIEEFKNLGGNKEIAYNTVYKLHLKYMNTDESKMDLVDDWLDCIAGCYSGNNIQW